MTEILDSSSRINMIKQKIQQTRGINIKWDIGTSYKDHIKKISELSCNQNCAIKADIGHDNGTYALIPAQSNLVDTELSFLEQSFELKSKTNEELLGHWKAACRNQEGSVIGEETEMKDIAISKEMFKRNPELREQIDLPQTLRLYNVLKQSEHKENKELLPTIEKDLQTKAWRYFASEKDYGSDKKVRWTPYSVSCLGEMRDYMVNKMHAPEDIIDPKLKFIETNMMSSIDNRTLDLHLSPNATKIVYQTAKKYPTHGSSQRIFKNINLECMDIKNKER